MDEKTHTTFGKVSLVLGIISFLLLFLSPIVLLFLRHTIPSTFLYELSISPVLIYLVNLFLLPTAIVAIILGFMARKQGDKYGRIGLIIGSIVIIIFIILMILSAIIYVSNMLSNP
jgi:MFS family permease